MITCSNSSILCNVKYLLSYFIVSVYFSDCYLVHFFFVVGTEELQYKSVRTIKYGKKSGYIFIFITLLSDVLRVL